jgi:hypothetical protein
MFIGMVALAMLVTVPLLGGRLWLLSGLQIRGLPVLLPTLLVQVLITDVVTGAPGPLLATAHVLTYVAAAYVIWLNRKVPGILILATGAALNAVAIAANGGTLPASASALRAAGIHEEPGFANSGVLAHPRLAFLGDITSTPSWLPFRNVISIGDIVILIGVFVLLQVTCATRLGQLVEQHRLDPVCPERSTTVSAEPALHPLTRC